MTEYEVIKKSTESEKIDENDKVYSIRSFLLHWITEEQIKWIWE